jgi:DNA repair exonuclease SbcCD ATPase subunit
MERAVTAFRPDGLPRMVIANQIGKLNKGIEEAMEGFGSPFGLSLSQDLDFVAEFESGKAPASVLSGGQMTMAAIAFRFAMLDMRASGCGIMALDEPTAFVDGANKQALIELLTRMDGFLASAGMAALVPTHDEELAGACSRIIKLDEGV